MIGFSKNLKFVSFSTLILVCAILLTSNVSAQALPTSFDSIILEVSPEFPEPSESVTITAKSYRVSIDASTITWSVDGRQVERGVGVRSISTLAPQSGKTKTVNVVVTTPEGLPSSQSIQLKSGSVDMILEPLGYTHPFFNGKGWPTYQTFTRVIAVPHLTDSSGKEYSPNNLLYTWKKDSGLVMQNESGYGKQFVDLEGSLIPRPFSLTVEVASRDGLAQGRGVISIAPSSPEIILYEDDPLYGPLFNKSLTSQLQIGARREVGILAVPFGFSFNPQRLESLDWSWMVNGYEQSDLENNNTIVLRAPDDEAGSAYIKLGVRHTAKFLQDAESGITVGFSKSRNSINSASNNAVF